MDDKGFNRLVNALYLRCDLLSLQRDRYGSLVYNTEVGRVAVKTRESQTYLPNNRHMDIYVDKNIHNIHSSQHNRRMTIEVFRA